MAGGLITNYLSQGAAASRPAAPDAATGTLSFYFATDTEVLSFYDWNDAAWQDLPTGIGTAAGLASTTEVLTGTSAVKLVTPDALAALWEQGSDIASAGTISIGEGGYFNVTGTTMITDIDPATDKAGRFFILKFAGILTLTHNATTLILPTGANITTAAGDTALFVSEGSDAIRCVTYQRADGTSLVSGGFTAASTTEVLTGTNTTKGVTPDALAALWEQGSDVASAGTISLGEGGYFNITGTTAITDIDFGTDKAGRTAWVKFAGALTLTHNATTLILPTGANITTAAGDTACFVSEGSDVVRCVAYQRKDGSALVGGSGTAASTTEQLTGTDTTKFATSDSVAALWEKGSDIASAATISIGEGGFFHVTGTTTITDIDFGTDKTGRTAILVFDGALTLTHNASTLILPGSANILTAAGDVAIFSSEGSDAVKCIHYLKNSRAVGNGWVLAGTGQTATGVYDQAVDGSKANIDFAGLGDFNELLVIARGLTCGTSGVRILQVSVDGGSSFYSASGDYVVISTTGAESNATGFNHSTASTAARGFSCHILNTKGAVKAGDVQNNTGNQTLFVASSSDINAIRVSNSAGGNITGGTVRVFAR